MHEGLDVLEFAIDRCEAHVGYFIEPAQLFHYDVAYLCRRDFCRERVRKLAFDLGNESGKLIVRDGALVAGFDKSGHDLVAVEDLVRTVLFNNENGGCFDYLVGREALVAGKALAEMLFREFNK